MARSADPRRRLSSQRGPKRTGDIGTILPGDDLEVARDIQRLWWERMRLERLVRKQKHDFDSLVIPNTGAGGATSPNPATTGFTPTSYVLLSGGGTVSSTASADMPGTNHVLIPNLKAGWDAGYELRYDYYYKGHPSIQSDWSSTLGGVHGSGHNSESGTSDIEFWKTGTIDNGSTPYTTGDETAYLIGNVPLLSPSKTFVKASVTLTWIARGSFIPSTAGQNDLQRLAADPDTPDSRIGRMYFNTTTHKMKIYVGGGTWETVTSV